MNHKLTLNLALVSLLAGACTTEEPNFAGMETNACLEGGCFGDLMCLSNVCVSEDTDGSGGESDGMNPSAGPSGTNGSNSAGTTSSDSTPGTSSPSTSGSSNTTGPDSDSDSDTLPDPTVGTGPTECGEVDVLFVADNSASMAAKHARLIEAAPAFVEELAIRTGSSDPHVMVADVDAWVFGGCATLCPLTACGAPFSCEETTPLECEDVLGAGVVHPRGTDASNEDCGFTSGGRFIDGSQPDLGAALQCALRVGTSGGQELTGLAVAEALDTMGDAQSCNTGFLRDDALLVIVFVTDEDDGPEDSPGVPAGWHTRVVAAKGGNTDQIFVLGIFGDNMQPNARCTDLKSDPNGGAEDSLRLGQFVEEFGGRGVRGSVCADDYSDSFDALLNTVATACE